MESASDAVPSVATTVTESTPIGSHVLAAGFRAADVATTTARVVVPPARPGETEATEPEKVLFLPHLLMREVL